MTITKGYVGAPGTQVHHRALGDPDAPPVVWLHQTASSSAMWERVLPLVPGARHLALDTPGFGASDPLPGAPGIRDYADRLLEAAAELAGGPFQLVAHHTGAVIAPELAIARSDLVRGLVLIGCVVVEDDAEEIDRRALYRRWGIDARGQYVVDEIIPRLLKSVTRDDPGQMASELVSYLQAGPDYTQAYDAVYSYRAAERLPLVDVPTWCTVGADEMDVMVRWTERAAGLIPGASYVPLPGVGCELAFEDPEVVAALVTDVLASLDAERVD